MDLIRRFVNWLLGKDEDDYFYEGRARRDNMSNPGDKDYEI